MIDKHNVLAQTFRRVRDFIHDDDQSDFGLGLFRHRFKDPRVYNTAIGDEVATLVVGDLSTLDVGRDIIVKKVSGQLTRLHETHTYFIPLQYPLIFPYGEDGYQEDIPIRDCHKYGQSRKRIHISLREFIAFRIQDRKVEFGNVVNSHRLFQ